MRVVDIEPNSVIVEHRQERPVGDLEGLISSIQEVGLLHPIVIGTDRKLKVGYRRLMAFRQMGRDTIPAHLTDDLNDIVQALKAERDENVQREGLPPTVMVERARELEEQERGAARERQGTRTDLQPCEKFPQSDEGKTRDKVGDAFGVSGVTYEHAKAVVEAAESDSETFGDLPAMMDEKSIHRAHRELIKRQRQEAPPLPDDKYRVWYADPPWRYNDSGVINDDNYGRAERHYPTMSIAELCAMGEQIKTRSQSDAVLFLWATSPLLEDAFRVIAAWGFEYKTSFVWDKVRHNFGHYNSVRHEFLLICTRGSCTPDHLELFDSVQEIERTDTHSEKPESFRQIIETLYTTGKRIELFARKDHDGWTTWGNEPDGEHRAC